MRMVAKMLAMSVVGLVAMGCQNKVAKENQAFHAQNQAQQAQLDEMRRQLAAAPDPAELASLRQDLAAKEAEIAALQDSLRQQPAGQPADPAIAGIETSYDAQSGQLTVNLPGDVLFASGQAELKSSAKATLDKVVKAIKENYPDKQIFVDGHTDSDPIRKTKDKWEDNHALAYSRAKSVMGYLTQNGVAEGKIVLRAYGPNSPKANKAASRRVEIVVSTR